MKPRRTWASLVISTIHIFSDVITREPSNDVVALHDVVKPSISQEKRAMVPLGLGQC